MANKITDTNNYSAIANSIRSKLGTQSTYTPSQMAAAIDSIPVTDIETLSVTDNGTYTAPTGTAYNPVTVNVSGGSSSKEPNAVNFYDYDGTIVDSYSASDFLALTAMPENPSHTGLTAQGWNWSLVDAQEFVTDYGKLNVGQMYITDDGKTRIYVHIPDNLLSISLGICPDGEVGIDYGDGTAVETVSGTSVTVSVENSHTYSMGGDYIITLSVTNGKFAIVGTGYGTRLLRDLNATDKANVNNIYYECIQKIELGNNVEIGDYAFSQCVRLKSVTIPYGITSIGMRCFYMNYSIKSIALPSGITDIASSAFYNCIKLENVEIPTGVITIGEQAIRGSAVIGDIIIPEGITDIAGSGFAQSCSLLKNVILANTITSIGHYAFSSTAINKIIIPENVITIGSGAFSSCYYMKEIHFRSTTPPTITNSTFNYIPTGFTIYVPSESLDAYKSATNFSQYAAYIVGE